MDSLRAGHKERREETSKRYACIAKGKAPENQNHVTDIECKKVSP